MTAEADTAPGTSADADGERVPSDAAGVSFAGAGTGQFYRRVRDRAFETGLFATTLAGLVVLFALLTYVAVDAFSLLDPEYGSWVDWQFLTSLPSRNPLEAGFKAPIVGSVLLLLVMVVGVFPLGVGAAIYLEEYAGSGLGTRLVRVNIANLAGVPSVVYGLLGLAVFVRGAGLESGIILVGGLTIGLLVLPIVIVSSQEALRSVPDSRRQASYGMGASRWQTIRNVILPEALPGILTGTILALARAIGETAPLIMIGAATSVFSVPTGMFDTATAMPLQIFNWHSRPQPEFRHGVVAAGVVILVTVMLTMNATAVLLRNKFQRDNS